MQIKLFFNLMTAQIQNEAKFNDFYDVCTNLTDEESFRIMKSEFKARPVNLRKDERIETHFTTCFIALMIRGYSKNV